MTVREKQCTKCKQFKPTNQFKRRLSLAQSRAVLRNPNITANYMADSKLCKACQPKRKPPRLLSIKEIRTRISNGDMHSVTGEIKIKQMREDIPKMRSRVMKEEWQKRRNVPVKELKKNLAQQVAKFASRYHATKSNNPQHAMLEQHRWNYEEAKRVRNYLMDRAQSGHYVDPTTRIESLIKPKQYNTQGEAQ